MQSILDQIQQNLGDRMGPLVWALIILAVGWVVAALLSALVRKGLRSTTLDKKIAVWVFGEQAAKGVQVERWLARTVYYVALIFVLILFLNALNLEGATEPLSQLLNQVLLFLPRLVSAALILLIAWVLARVLKFAISRGLEATKFDERLGGRAGLESKKIAPLSKTLAEVLYWIVLLLFLPAALRALGLQGVMAPVESMTNQILGALPNIFEAGLILFLSWIVARIVQGMISNLLAAMGADRLGEKIGLGTTFGSRRLSELIGLIVYVVIIIFAVITSLNKLNLETIAGPARNMLGEVIGTIPAVLTAAALLFLAYFLGKFLASLAADILAGAGFNDLLARLGFAKQPAKSERTPSAIAGYLLLVVIMLFAGIEASRLIGFTALADLLHRFTIFTGEIIFALIVFGVGLYLAHVVSHTVQSSSAPQAPYLAMAARVSIIVLAGAIALQHMGLAGDIIRLAFGIVLGAISVAAALAFGLGGRDLASKKLQGWFDTLKKR